MDIFKDYGLNITENMQKQFDRYTELLLEYNQKFNLTAIVNPDEIKIKHYLDSLAGAEFIAEKASVIDVGSGAGFPAIPLKIYRNDLKITMLDSLNKRVNFLNLAVKVLGLSDAKAVHFRAEDAGKTELRESFDFAVARAVADMAVLSEYTLPFVKPGGKLIAYKGDVDEELDNAERAINILGGKLEKVNKFTLPDGSKRSIIIVKKVAKTPVKYPRGQNKPRIKPL